MTLAYKLLAALVAVIVLVGGGYRWGAVATTNARAAKDAKDAAIALELYRAEEKRGYQASLDNQAEQQAQAARYDDLQGAFNEYKRSRPILAVRRPATGAASQLAGRADPGAGSGAGQAAQCAAAPAIADAADPGEPALSHGAVWMWNSALAGADQPSGACGLADPTAQACAADSGVTLQRAWDNQALNARLCAEDRLRHQNLIDRVRARDGTPSTTKETP